MQRGIELWGGVECTINRVGDRFYDQLAWSGHRDRVREDLTLFADLGFKRLRTAVHWEHLEQTGSWESTDRTLTVMKEKGLHPIVGLLHHGSGPTTTNFLDPAFPEKFAAFALQVAIRYPWVTDYTPINEPQTTGRFSCLYRHWFPHHCSMKSYVRAMYNQIKAIALAMAAIRSVQPNARLIHTEDGGETFSTPSLDFSRQQREHRRWLGIDMLCGCIDRNHPLFDFLLEQGLSEQEVLWFAANRSAPDVIGLNYYVTSDRFLDDRLHLYPEHLRGGDTGRELLVDIEAVRVRPEGINGVGAMLTSAWNRYHIPVAVSEAHLGCEEPAEQVRWLAEVWREANEARKNGVDVAAVTVWALLGLYNWSNLCTEDNRLYEPGVFDLSAGVPVETELTTMVRQLSKGHPIEHQDFGGEGWWRLDSRLTLPSPYPV